MRSPSSSSSKVSRVRLGWQKVRPGGSSGFIMQYCPSAQISVNPYLRVCRGAKGAGNYAVQSFSQLWRLTIASIRAREAVWDTPTEPGAFNACRDLATERSWSAAWAIARKLYNKFIMPESAALSRRTFCSWILPAFKRYLFYRKKQRVALKLSSISGNCIALTVPLGKYLTRYCDKQNCRGKSPCTDKIHSFEIILCDLVT